MIEFLSGSLSMAYFIAGIYFLRFWKRSSDSLFLNFALAFMLFALNQVLAWFWGSADERSGYTYVLRVLGFVLILVAIISKNTHAKRDKR